MSDKIIELFDSLSFNHNCNIGYLKPKISEIEEIAEIANKKKCNLHIIDNDISVIHKSNLIGIESINLNINNINSIKSDFFDYIFVDNFSIHSIENLQDFLLYATTISETVAILGHNFGYYKHRCNYLINSSIKYNLIPFECDQYSDKLIKFDIKDFIKLCNLNGIVVDRIWIEKKEKIYDYYNSLFANLFASNFIAIVVKNNNILSDMAINGS
jgi:hypothetical protein